MMKQCEHCGMWYTEVTHVSPPVNRTGPQDFASGCAITPGSLVGNEEAKCRS
jgi:hypothetical protein